VINQAEWDKIRTERPDQCFGINYKGQGAVLRSFPTSGALLLFELVSLLVLLVEVELLLELL
jgi:hypothetical protein